MGFVQMEWLHLIAVFLQPSGKRFYTLSCYRLSVSVKAELETRILTSALHQQLCRGVQVR